MSKSTTKTIRLLVTLFGLSTGYSEEIEVQYHGAGWLQFGRIEHMSDTITNQPENNFNDNWNQNTGGQITAVVRINENWEGGLGLGAIQVHGARSTYEFENNWNLQWAPYVTEARATFFVGTEDSHRLKATIGSFPYNYNSDVKNLGLYLNRGLVYPGAVISGFETSHVLPIATVFGAQIKHEAGEFSHEVILNSETEIKPLFDMSLLYLIKYKFSSAFELGAGINFYRLIPQRAEVTSPEVGCAAGKNLFRYLFTGGDPEVCYSLDTLYADTGVVLDPISGEAVIDTVTGSLSGTKVMGRFRFDPKSLFGSPELLGNDDLVLYSEFAILGLKDQGKYFDNVWERIPVMVGFNIPAFGLLDHISLELEYYGTPNYHDYGKTVNYGTWVPRVVNDSNAVPIEFKNDNWKWSVYASKVFLGHMKLSAQVARDHLRTGGYALKPNNAEALTDSKDWYWMMKMAYFF